MRKKRGAKRGARIKTWMTAKAMYMETIFGVDFDLEMTLE
jgi:hypothetical protein